MKLSKDKCILLLRDMMQSTGRFPKKSDFSEDEVAMIKSYFGPWPRALEAAGLKESKADSKKIRRLEKKIQKKRAQNAIRKQNKNK